MTTERPNVLYELLNGAETSSPRHTETESAMMELTHSDSLSSLDSNSQSVMQECNVVVLGSSKVGKTCLLQMLVNNNYYENYEPTTTCQVYRKALFIDGGYIYDLVLRDCPGVSYFPMDSVSEWTDYRGYGLLRAHVYVLVYDSSNYEATFAYVQNMREKIVSLRGPQVLILVVGCKHDLVDSVKGEIKDSLKDLAKKWKCPFVMCSPKFNWGVMKVCAEIVKLLEMERESTKLTTNRMSSRWPLNNCSIM